MAKKKPPKDKKFWEPYAPKQSPKKKTSRPGARTSKPGDKRGKGKKASAQARKPVNARPSPDEPIRLNRFIAQSGICSRREADAYIQQGQVKVNGEVVKEMGIKVVPARDTVLFKNKPLAAEKLVYILLNKPKNTITTTSDPEGRRTVLDAIGSATEARVFPVGRLDRNTTGLLLLTNDGEMAKKLTHPSHNVKKLYHARLDKEMTEEDMQKLLSGIELEDGPARVDNIDYVMDRDKHHVGVSIHIGRNRIVRRMFEALGYEVETLDRVMLAHLTKKNLPRGQWRHLTASEVNFLKMI